MQTYKQVINTERLGDIEARRFLASDGTESASLKLGDTMVFSHLGSEGISTAKNIIQALTAVIEAPISLYSVEPAAPASDEDIIDEDDINAYKPPADAIDFDDDIPF